MKKNLLMTLVALTLVCTNAASAAPGGVAKNTVDKNAAEKSVPEMARVNDEVLPLAWFELMLKDQLRTGAPDSVALREGIRRDLVLQSLLSQLASQQRLDKTAEVQVRAELARKAVLAGAWQQQWLQANPVSDADLQNEYDTLVQRSGSKEYLVRQVLLRDETSARLVLDQVKAGRKLEDLARAYSQDERSKAEGGLLPWLNAGALIGPVGDVIAKAKVGQPIAEPVKTAAGWHVLELVGERPFTVPPFEQLKPQLQQALTQRKMEAALQAEVNKAKIVLR